MKMRVRPRREGRKTSAPEGIATRPTKPGAVARPSVHVSIDVPDIEAGLRFYESVFGFVEVARPFPAMAILDANNVTVCMHEKPPGTKPSPHGTDVRRYERHWTPVHVDLHVHDFDGVVAKVRTEGGLIEQEYREQGFGAEARWNVSLTPGHSYRIQVLVHDGDQNKAGGDSGEACVLFCAGGTCSECDSGGTGGSGGTNCPDGLISCGGEVGANACPTGTMS